MWTLTCLALVALFAEPPQADFSGHWKMDAARSESAHQAVPIGNVVIIIAQSGNDLTIETRRTEADKTRTQTEILPYKLTGEETTTVINGEPVKTKARWDGPSLVTESVRNINNSTVTTHYVHTLQNNGKELKIDKKLTVQHGYQFEGSKSYGTGVDIFLRTAK